MTIERRATSAELTSFSAPSRTPADLVAEAIGCILRGEPYPAHLRPTILAVGRPSCVADGIGRIIGAPIEA